MHKIVAQMKRFQSGEGDIGGFTAEEFEFHREKAEKMPYESLIFALKDLTEVITLQEQMKKEGHPVPKLGKYWDEYWTILDEKKRRNKNPEEKPVRGPKGMTDEGLDHNISDLEDTIPKQMGMRLEGLDTPKLETYGHELKDLRAEKERRGK